MAKEVFQSSDGNSDVFDVIEDSDLMELVTSGGRFWVGLESSVSVRWWILVGSVSVIAVSC